VWDSFNCKVSLEVATTISSTLVRMEVVVLRKHVSRLCTNDILPLPNALFAIFHCLFISDADTSVLFFVLFILC